MCGRQQVVELGTDLVQRAEHRRPGSEITHARVVRELERPGEQLASHIGRARRVEQLFSPPLHGETAVAVETLARRAEAPRRWRAAWRSSGLIGTPRQLVEVESLVRHPTSLGPRTTPLHPVTQGQCRSRPPRSWGREFRWPRPADSAGRSPRTISPRAGPPWSRAAMPSAPARSPRTSTPRHRPADPPRRPESLADALTDVEKVSALVVTAAERDRNTLAAYNVARALQPARSGRGPPTASISCCTAGVEEGRDRHP